MDDLRQAAQAALGLLTSPYVTSDDWSKVRDMLRAALAQPEHSMTHVDIARNVLTHLGRSISPSREPGADEHVDRLAAKLAEWLAQPEPQPTSWRPIETAPNDEIGRASCRERVSSPV